MENKANKIAICWQHDIKKSEERWCNSRHWHCVGDSDVCI